ncbi:hypothetical protein BAY61_22825 [Prauserella marina]|nr:hypothetical protein BAY61_22825 [Prauserella marina]
MPGDEQPCDSGGDIEGPGGRPGAAVNWRDAGRGVVPRDTIARGVGADGTRPEAAEGGRRGEPEPPSGVLRVVGGDGVCAECAIPRYRLPPETLWLADGHGNSFCCECLTVLELTAELLALASGALRGLDGEWFP